MRINTNVSSLTAQDAAANTGKSITSSLEKLSTGLRINKSSDDASGLAIADKLRTQATSIGQGVSNGNSAVALLQIADKSMGEQSNILDTIKAKLVQANTDTTSDDGREAIRKDIQKLLTQLDNIATQTNYNGKSLLADVKDGKLTGKEASALNFQIGASNSDIVSTSNINSTSSSLGGGSEDISKIKAGETKTLQNGSAGTLNVSGASGKGIDVSISGNIGNVTGTGGDLILQTSDASAMAKLDKLTTAGGTAGTDNLVEIATGVYQLKTAGTLDLSDINFTDLTIKSKTDTDTVSFSSDSSSFKVTNNDFANELTVSANENLEAKAETTVKAVLGNNLTVATSGASANLTISGNLGTLGTTGGKALTITATDSATIAKLEEIAALDAADGFTSNGNGEFELAADKSIDLSTVDFKSVNIKNDGGFTAGDQVFSTTSKTAITIKNNLTDGLNIENKTVESGSNLGSLKNLAEGGLTQTVASSFQTVVDDAITQLNGYRGDIGSTQNQVESAVRNLQTQQTNIKAAESVIRDVDYAQESANFNKQNIISQAGSYAISQANAVQQNVLRLLQ